MSMSGSRQAGNGQKGSHRRTNRTGGTGSWGYGKYSYHSFVIEVALFIMGVNRDYICIACIVLFLSG